MTSQVLDCLSHKRSGLSLLLAMVTINLLALLAFVWALSDAIEVTIHVQGNTYTATINGRSLPLVDERYPEGDISLLLADFQSYLAYTPPAKILGGAFAERLINWIAVKHFPSNWESIAIADEATGVELLRAGFGWRRIPPKEQVILEEYPGRFWGFTIGGNRAWKEYVIKARLARGREPAGIMVRGRGSEEGYLFWFRPEHEDMGWDLVWEGRVVERLETGGFRQTFLSALRATLRELLWCYFYGLAILALFAGVCFALATALDRWSIVPRRFLRLPRPGIIALSICLVALVMTAVISSILLRRIPHVQDSVTYLFQAKTLAMGRLYVPSPPLPQFFEQEFIVNRDGMWFGKYPPGYPLLLTVGVLLGIPWLVGPVLGSLSLMLVYWLGREAYGARLGLLAAALGLTSPFFLFMSASFMSHPSSMFFLLLFMLCFIKSLRSRGIWALFAGIALGFAFITRQLSTLSLTAPFLLYLFYSFVRDPKGYSRRVLLMLFGALGPCLFLLWYNSVLTGSPFASTSELWWSFDKVGLGEEYGMRGGHTSAEGLVNTWRNTTTLLVHLFGWPNYLTLAFLFLPFATLRASRWDYLLLASFLALVGGYVFYWADGIMYGPRYYYEALPLLLLLTARGIMLLVNIARELAESRLGRLLASQKSFEVSGWLLAACILLALVAYNLVFYMPVQWSVYKDYNYVSAANLDLVKKQDLHNALIFVEHEPGWMWWKYGSVFSANSPFLDSDVVYARDLGDAEDERLMDFFPGRRYYRLSGGKLAPLGSKF